MYSSEQSSVCIAQGAAQVWPLAFWAKAGALYDDVGNDKVLHSFDQIQKRGCYTMTRTVTGSHSRHHRPALEAEEAMCLML